FSLGVLTGRTHVAAPWGGVGIVACAGSAAGAVPSRRGCRPARPPTIPARRVSPRLAYGFEP
ncbi:MAG: hypothetical protein ABIZ91_04110, partial [Gemmatimonadaceae bacterium]